MVYSATLSSSGQVTLPSALRKVLNIKSGEKVIFTETSTGNITIKRQPTPREDILTTAQELDSAIASLPSKVQTKITQHAGKTAAQLRQELNDNPATKKYYKEKYAL